MGAPPSPQAGKKKTKAVCTSNRLHPKLHTSLLYSRWKIVVFIKLQAKHILYLARFWSAHWIDIVQYYLAKREDLRITVKRRNWCLFFTWQWQHEECTSILWRFSTAWYGTVRHGSVRYGTAQFGSVAFPPQFSTAIEWAGLFTRRYNCAASTAVTSS